MELSSVDSDALLRVSFGKILASKRERGGARLHKSLMVLNVMKRAKQHIYARSAFDFQHVLTYKERIAAQGLLLTASTPPPLSPQPIRLEQANHQEPIRLDLGYQQEPIILRRHSQLSEEDPPTRFTSEMIQPPKLDLTSLSISSDSSAETRDDSNSVPTMTSSIDIESKRPVSSDSGSGSDTDSSDESEDETKHRNKTASLTKRKRKHSNSVSGTNSESKRERVNGLIDTTAGVKTDDNSGITNYSRLSGICTTITEQVQLQTPFNDVTFNDVTITLTTPSQAPPLGLALTTPSEPPPPPCPDALTPTIEPAAPHGGTLPPPSEPQRITVPIYNLINLLNCHFSQLLRQQQEQLSNSQSDRDSTFSQSDRSTFHRSQSTPILQCQNPTLSAHHEKPVFITSHDSLVSWPSVQLTVLH